MLSRARPAADSVEMTTATPAGLRSEPRLLLSLPERLAGLSVSPGGDWLLVSSAAAVRPTTPNASNRSCADTSPPPDKMLRCF